MAAYSECSIYRFVIWLISRWCVRRRKSRIFAFTNDWKILWASRKLKKKGRKLVSIMIILNIWDEIYLRICFLGDDSTKIVAAIATSFSLSLLGNQFQVMKKSREEWFNPRLFNLTQLVAHVPRDGCIPKQSCLMADGHVLFPTFYTIQTVPLSVILRRLPTHLLFRVSRNISHLRHCLLSKTDERCILRGVSPFPHSGSPWN